jgi:hypothetical protein
MFAMKFRRQARPAAAAPRQHFSLVTMLRGAGTSATVLVHDISNTGFLAECVVKFPTGARVCINLPGLGNVDARVKSTRRGGLAATFLKPIDLDRCVAAAEAEASPAARPRLELI